MRADWMDDETRAPWVGNSLRVRISDIRKAEKLCRTSFKKDYMGEPSKWLADAFKDAADTLQKRYDELYPKQR